ncbi:phosphatidylglycerophosphatase A [Pseudoalteromonas sp. McH1-7]|uniref:Phosphatidylglycerophosphatase A n=1 Tax=Pseudoalteromonas peptidolytica F12-50-A1 TaxID=1315280 RepID=A0A8I0MTF3_9GAMM|nr:MULTISPECIES: phosphatidylglycerophosphatase A [Pseudoalteromonas]MBE0345500.1 phosphatidylglycerophosphatase A [Pseudoalteromonas peptidolytica F12-50-A1]MDW7547603.1 phosphatidylglycerophosphatase A [Pseudoalteromonas peptidolytica]NLR13445.1 phosphatidylglycerophosphatase A [Pseudoalteromonas peptidolytica]NUZ09715.1 phosphatidylglycerophosphatase A [Pseudoalteromonas sp. McH1-7]RRS10171.1 phosphatidylglycerophosphatase A [Pseudoalteromonas sp. J010]
MAKQYKFNLKKPHQFLALGFGLGLAKKAPGTVGTFAALPFILLTQSAPVWLQCLVAIVMTLLGIWLCGKTATDVNVHDHPAIVWDEVAGFYITMIGAAISWQSLVVGFILFRFFDIFKPGPIRWLDKRLHGGSGIMLDDVLAGVFSLICVQALFKTGILV